GIIFLRAKPIKRVIGPMLATQSACTTTLLSNRKRRAFKAVHRRSGSQNFFEKWKGMSTVSGGCGLVYQKRSSNRVRGTSNSTAAGLREGSGLLKRLATESVRWCARMKRQLRFWNWKGRFVSAY